MDFFLETTDMDLGDTPIENIFINDFMPMANGTYVKVYLLGFKYAHDKDLNIEVDNRTIAKHLNISMEDVFRAWDFWENKGIIEKIFKDEDREDYKVRFLNLKQLYIKNNINLFKNDKNIKIEQSDKDFSILQNKKTFTMEDFIEAQKMPEINKMLKNIDFMMRRQTVPTEKMKIVDWINDYNMSPEVIQKAFEYSIEQRGIRRLNYVEAIIRDWYDEGITDLESVMEKLKSDNERFYIYTSIMKELGLNNRPIRSDEKELIDKWLDEKKYSYDLIIEACKRDKNAKPSLKYVNGILKSWERKGIKNKDEIELLDENITKKDSKIKKKNNGYSNKTIYKTRFHNFKQRSDLYTEEELEKIARRKREEHIKRLKGEV